MFFVSSPIWIILVMAGLSDTFDEDTWKRKHVDLELKLYNCKELYTGYNSRGDGKAPLRGDEIHSESECKSSEKKSIRTIKIKQRRISIRLENGQYRGLG